MDWDGGSVISPVFQVPLSFFSTIFSCHSEAHFTAITWAAQPQSEQLYSKQEEGGRAKVLAS